GTASGPNHIDTRAGTVILSYDSYRLVRFQLNFKSGTPVYLQLVDQVKSAVAAGALRAGGGLASLRPLAAKPRRDRNTLAEAYAELEAQGIIETLAGKGSFVRATSSPLRKDARVRLLAEKIDDAIVQAHHLQIDKDEFVQLAEDRFERFEGQRARAERG